MTNKFRKTTTVATVLFSAILFAAAGSKAQSQAPATPGLTDAQAQLLFQALLAQQASGQKLTPAQAQLLTQYLAAQSRAAALSSSTSAQAQTPMQGFTGQGRGGAVPSIGQPFPQNPAQPAGAATLPTLGPKRPGVVRIGVVQPKAQMGQGNSGMNVAEPIRTTIMQYLTGPSQEVVPLMAMLPSQIDAEAKSKDCDYVLYSIMSQKLGGGGLGALKKIGAMSSMVPGIGMATGTMTGMMVGAAAGSAVSGAASVAGTVKAKGVVTLDYKLMAPGSTSALIANTDNLKATTDGQDVISPLVEKAATAILDAVSKKK
jgi:hypothetical protein